VLVDELLEEPVAWLAGVELLLPVEELLLLPHPATSAAQSAKARSVGNRLGFIGAPLWLKPAGPLRTAGRSS
jgi:hypothetical protein